MADAAPIEGEFDYIVVGAGSAGCVLANRLSADPANRVLLLEAGGSDNWIWFHIPVGYLFAIGNPRADWMLKTELEPGCLVEGVEFTGKRAIGVRWRQNGVVRNARCRGEVVLAAGSIGSPHLLMLSGVGPAAQLSKFGIRVLLDKPGVGANLHDHLQLRMIYKVSGIKTLNETYASLPRRLAMGADYLLRRRGPMTMAPSQLGAFTRSDKTQDRANIQYHVQPLSLDTFGEPLHPFPAFTASVANIRPTSRGALSLKSADPREPPAIAPNYLATPEDRRVAADSIRVTRKIVSQPALRKYSPVEYLPGGAVRDEDEAALEKAAGDIGTTIFHPVGTARMGRNDDARAVVDARLRVIGIDGLRVIDASVMPSITSGNTNSPTMMIAEKGAAMILEDRSR